MSEEYTQLVKRCRKHDERAMRALYEEMAPMAMGVCMRYSHNRETAQDLMQEGYIKVYEGLKKVREPEKVMSWVYHVMVNECINYCRRAKPTEYLEDAKDALLRPTLTSASDGAVMGFAFSVTARAAVWSSVRLWPAAFRIDAST